MCIYIHIQVFIGKVTAAGWQVTLCDPMWHVISRSGEVISITNCYFRVLMIKLLLTFYGSYNT